MHGLALRSVLTLDRCKQSNDVYVTRIIVIDLMHPIRSDSYNNNLYLFFGPSSLASRVQFEEPKFILIADPTMDHSQNILGENSCSSSYKSNRSWDGISELFVDETGKECWCTNTWVLNYTISPFPFSKLPQALSVSNKSSFSNIKGMAFCPKAAQQRHHMFLRLYQYSTAIQLPSVFCFRKVRPVLQCFTI